MLVWREWTSFGSVCDKKWGLHKGEQGREEVVSFRDCGFNPLFEVRVRKKERWAMCYHQEMGIYHSGNWPVLPALSVFYSRWTAHSYGVLTWDKFFLPIFPAKWTKCGHYFMFTGADATQNLTHYVLFLNSSGATHFLVFNTFYNLSTSSGKNLRTAI